MKTLERLNQRIYIIKNNEIEEDIFKSIIEDYFRDETTSPKGVMPRMHIRKNENEETFELWTWGILGQFPKFQKSFETENEANDALWECWLNNYDYDDGSGLNNAPAFFFEKEDAKEYLKNK